MVANTDRDPNAFTEEELTNADSYDVLTWTAGDIIDLSGIDANTILDGNQDFGFSKDSAASWGGTDAIDTAGTAGNAILQTGAYDALNGDFTHTAAGSDGLLVINDGANVAYIVIVGGAPLATSDFIGLNVI